MPYRPSPIRPVAPDPDLIHQSTRTSISTNAGATPYEPARITLRTSRLDVRWTDGDVVLRFSMQEVDVTPSRGARPGRSAR